MVTNDRFFLDSGYLIALEVENDQHHDEAAKHWPCVFEEPLIFVTTSYVLDEVVTFLNSRRQHSKAIRIGGNLQTLQTSNSFMWTRISSEKGGSTSSSTVTRASRLQTVFLSS